MYYLGIDLGGTNIAAGLVSADGKVMRKDSIPTRREADYRELVKDMAALMRKLLKDAGVREEEVKGVGIGSPGILDEKKGILIYASNLQNLKGAPLVSEMEKYVNCPVYLGNDANVAALAESEAGAARGSRHSVTVTLGTGVGSGAVIDGKIYSGFNGAALELGHMVIVVDGEPCGCGRKGCWETYASATALVRQTRKAAREHPESMVNKLVDGDLSKINGRTAFDAARQGDEVGKLLVEQYIKYVAEGLINIISIFMPEVLVLGGGICNEGEYLLNPLKEHVLKRFTNYVLPLTEIRLAQMGNDAGIVGAAMLAKTAKEGG